MQYSDFQNLASSEKITLAILEATTRLVGWVLHSGSVYKITGFDKQAISMIEDSGNAYTAVSDIGSVTASKYYHDRDNKILYLRATDSSNPNGRFLVLTFKSFFANVPIALPNDLDSGYVVFFEDLIKSTSEFGVEIDTVNQTSEAIEGSGELTLYNDHDFWPSNFDKVVFENQKCLLYSYHRDLPLSEKKLIFKGRVLKKAYKSDTITFQLQDQFAELRATIQLDTIGSLNAKTPSDLEDASQRLILGRVFGHVPTNIDQVVDGYPLTGTLSATFGSIDVTGTGTAFLSELSPGDSIVLNGQESNVATVVDDETLTLTDEFSTGSVVDVNGLVKPDKPKRNMNRIFNVAGHALREPSTTISGDSTILRLQVDDTADFYPDDIIYVGTLGSGELTKVRGVIGQHYLLLSTSLATVPTFGTTVLRPAIQNVRIANVPLVYYRDYTFDADTAVLTLRNTAEKNAGPIFQMASSITLTNTSRSVTGTGFQGIIFPGFMIGVVGNTDFFEVLSVEDDSNLTLRTPATFTSTAIGRYQSFVYDPDNGMVVSLDVLGATEDGTTSGVLMKTAPSISKYLLKRAGLESELDESSFDNAEDIAYQHLGLVVPTLFSDTELPIYRDVLNSINISVIGSLVQNGEFKFAYQVLRPKKTIAATKFSESDILSFDLNSTADNVVKTAIVEYHPREYDPLTDDSAINTEQKTSNNSTYLLKTDTTKTITTLLVEQRDARIMANRWAFILESATGVLSFTTKMQGFTLQVGDIVQLTHRKFFERYGGNDKSKLALVQGVKRSGSTVTVDATDLSNTFNRVACINDFTNDWSSASDTERLYGGYITDQYGLIDNDPLNFGSNLIW